MENGPLYLASIRASDYIQKYFSEGAPYETWVKCNHDHARCALEMEFDAVAESAARRCAEIVAVVHGCGVAYNRILREFSLSEPTSDPPTPQSSGGSGDVEALLREDK